MQQGPALVEERPVERLIVLSPYWDEDLSALRHLATVLQPQEIVILIDRDKGLFPGEALHDLPETKIFDLAAFGHGRFIHAKAIIAQTQGADHLLYGSVNCTVAALGTGNFPGINDEACLYRRLARDEIIETLHLAETLNSGRSNRGTCLLSPSMRLFRSMKPSYVRRGVSSVYSTRSSGGPRFR
jgi:hypothetical protein